MAEEQIVDENPGYTWTTEEYGRVPDEEPLAILQEMFDKGLIFLVNQNALHHYGYALGVTVEEGKVKGLNLHKSSDPEGIWFDEELTQSGRQKMREAGLR